MTLPLPSNSFVGRQEDLARLRTRCARGASIVTLWGAPGIGKTRLAVELCRDALAGETRASKVWFCDLGRARNAADVCLAVRHALGGDPGAHPTPRWISAALSRCPAGLWLLDGFDQVIACAAETVGAWAEAAPQLCFLVTSHERLRLCAELTHEVAPLGVEAAQLFLDRVRTWAPSIANAVDPDALGELLARLEGIPLAIELAAARADVLGVAGLCAALEQPLDVLAHGARDAAPRHATLRMAIDASVQRLSEHERRALGQCSVFAGSFGLAAAEAVVDRPPGVPALDTLQALRDRSLLRCAAHGVRVRFSFFEAVRAHAREALDALGDGAAARARHARYYLGLPEVEAADHANLIDAAAHALEAEASAGRVVAALARIEPSLAPDAIVELLARAVLIAERQGTDARTCALGHRALGRAYELRGQRDAACAELGAAIAAAAGDDGLGAALSADLGVVHHRGRRMEPARAHYEVALASAERAGDGGLRARSLGNLGALHHDLRRYDAARDHYERAAAAFRAAGDARLEGALLTNLGVLWQERGAFDRARRVYHDAIALLAGVDRRLEAIALTNLGFLDHQQGVLDAAVARHQRALGILGALVDPRSEGLCLGRMAMATAALGDPTEAALDCRRGERILARLDDSVAMATFDLFRAYVDAVADPSAEAVARERVERARAPAFDGGAALIDLCDDARTAIRLIEALLAARANGRPEAELVIGPQLCWYALPSGETHELGRRQVLRRLLGRLVDHHREVPGEGLSLAALREAGWPAEQMGRPAAANRVHVALAELRRRGLKPWLVCHDGRYYIDPALRIRASDSRQAPWRAARK